MKIKKLNIQFGKTEKVQNKSKKSRKNKNKKEINKIKSKKGNIYNRFTGRKKQWTMKQTANLKKKKYIKI